MNRDFSLKERAENTRDQQQIRRVVHLNYKKLKIDLMKVYVT